MILDATDIRISVADRFIAAITEASLSFKVNTRETTRFVTGAAQTFVASTTSWQISGNSFATFNQGYSMINLLRASQARQLVNVSFSIVDPVIGAIHMSGSGIITSVGASGSTGQDMKLSFTLEGSGELTDNAQLPVEYQLTTYIRPSNFNMQPIVKFFPAGSKTIQTAPDINREFMHWKAVGGEILGTSRDLIFTMPPNNTALYAWYYDRKIVIFNDPFGTISYMGIEIVEEVETYSFSDGIPIQFSCVPASGYQFIEWEIIFDDDTIANPTANPFSQTVSGKGFSIRAIINPIP
jgi:hypothetical protein